MAREHCHHCGAQILIGGPLVLKHEGQVFCNRMCLRDAGLAEAKPEEPVPMCDHCGKGLPEEGRCYLDGGAFCSSECHKRAQGATLGALILDNTRIGDVGNWKLELGADGAFRLTFWGHVGQTDGGRELLVALLTGQQPEPPKVEE